MKPDNHGLKILVYTFVIFFTLAFAAAKTEDWLRENYPELFELPIPQGWKKMPVVPSEQSKETAR